jgi:beta-lactamase class A
MAIGITRRAALAGTALMLAAQRAFSGETAEAQLAELERVNGGRIGVAALDTASGKRIEHRSDERFAMCSTFKFLLAGCALARVDRNEEQLDRSIVFAESDLVTYSPVTKTHVGQGGMSVADLCEAAMTLSDNTAANLLLAACGGPPGLTAFARSLGDTMTRLDRIETALNEATPGDPRDTTTPAAMLGTMQKLVLGDALAPTSRALLGDWLVGNKTGGKRLRAGFPKDWRVGDKTGSGGNGATNDIAVAWPPGRSPILVTAYFTESPASPEARDGVLAAVARIVAERS